MNHWQSILSPLISQTPWLVATDVVVAGGGIAKELQTLGAPSCFIVGGSMGTGTVPETPFVELGLSSTSMMDGIRKAEQALDALPESVVDQINAWDPAAQARVFRPFFSKGQPVAGRATFGARPQAWQDLEDKTRIDALWAEAGVPHAPARIVGTSRAEIETAWSELDQGQGVVLSGDSKLGFNGGASYVRWLRAPGDLDEVLPMFQADCDQLRLMPFIEGIPCSIHGFVVPGPGGQAQVASFLPCEMLVFRVPGTGRFTYASTATTWTPPEPDAQAMRALAKHIGAHIHRALDYRGAFTIDGVMSATGFLPTELNPRVGAAMYPLFSGLDMPITLLHYAAIEGAELDWRLQDLEDLVLRAPPRMGRGGLMVTSPQKAQRQWFLGSQDQGFAEVPEDQATWSVSLGPGPTGGYLRIVSQPDKIAVGPSFAPQLAPLVAHLDRALDLGIGALDPAKSVR